MSDEHDRAVRLAWNIAALERRQKLPELETLLSKRNRLKGQTTEQQRVMLQTLSARYGVPLRKTRLIHVEARG